MWRNRLLKGTVVAVVAVLATAEVAPSPAKAAVTVVAKEVGTNVVLTSTGSLDLRGLTFQSNIVYGSPFISPRDGAFRLGPNAFTLMDIYAGASGPSSFGAGRGVNYPTTGSGGPVGVRSLGFVDVPRNYVSGSDFSASATFAGTFDSLGLTQGTYVWSWSGATVQGVSLDSVGGDSITLKIVPVPAALPLLGTALAGLGVIGWRRRRSHGA